MNQTERRTTTTVFSEEEYRKGIAALKYKAASIDDVLVEQLKNQGPRAHKWLLIMLTKCLTDNKIQNIWRQSKIIDILKPGKDPAITELYTNIPLMPHIQVI